MCIRDSFSEGDAVNAVLTCADLGTAPLRALLARFGLELIEVALGDPIPGSWFGEPEAGIITRCVYVRPDTPVHSALHESCHLICIDEQRRSRLHTDAGGDYEEENGVNYLQILLADFLPGMGRERMLTDMDRWGYTYRLGSARAWFEHDSAQAAQWLRAHGWIGIDDTPCWRLRA
jgi:hypothetical protein